MSRVDVVVAVIIQNGRILLTQRKPDGSYPWLFESPGGKVEPGESRDAAVEREVYEELNVTAISHGPIAAIAPVDLPSRDGQVPRRVHFHRVTIHVGQPTNRVAVGLGWFTADELAGLKMTPANDARREELVMLVRGG